MMTNYTRFDYVAAQGVAIGPKGQEVLMMQNPLPSQSSTFQILAIPITAPNPPAEDMQPTSVFLPANCLMKDIWLDVKVPETSGTNKTIGIGLVDESPYEFANGLPVANTGFIRPNANLVIGISETYFDSCSRGAALCEFKAGSDNAGDHGLYQERPCFTSACEVAWIPGSGDWATFMGMIYIEYIEFS